MDYDALELAEHYAEARELLPETELLWSESIAAMTPSTGVRRVADIGAGTGRFAPLLAELFAGVVVAVDPSRAMLAQRDRTASTAAFVAGSAEALPLRSGSMDLVFISMVYHHFRSVPAALAELRRVLRSGGYAVVRNTTRETHDAFEYLDFFPEARRLDRDRMPSRHELRAAFGAAGFAGRGHRTVRQKFAADYAEYYRKISLRGLSSLRIIPDEDFARGLQALQAHCRRAEGGTPVWEPVDLFAFQATP